MFINIYPPNLRYEKRQIFLPACFKLFNFIFLYNLSKIRCKGKYKIFKCRINNITATKNDKGEDIMFCVMHNDRMLWPTMNGSYTNYHHWYNLTAEGAAVMHDAALSANLQGLRVENGDRIRFCFVARTGHSMNTKDVDLSVSYTAIDSSLPRPSDVGSTLADWYPTMRQTEEGGGLLGYRGRWWYAATKDGDLYTALTKTDAENNLIAGTTAQAGCVVTRYNGAAAAGLCPGEYDVAVCYRVRYAGRISLSLGALDTGSSDRYTVSIYKNDTRLRPPSTGTAAELASLTQSITVSGGDQLTLRRGGCRARAAVSRACRFLRKNDRPGRRDRCQHGALL